MSGDISGRGAIDCREARRHLFEFIDDELEPALSHAVDRHLEACLECRAEAEETRAFESRVRGACREQGGAEAFRERFLGALDAEIASERRGRSRGRSVLRIVRRAGAVMLSTAAAALLVVMLLPGPAAAEFVRDHVMCLGMRTDWETSPAGIPEVVHAVAGEGVAVPDLASEGYHPARGAACAVNGIPYVHLVYEGPGKDAISVVVGRRYHGLAGRLRSAVRVVSEGAWGVVDVRRDDGSEVHVVGRPAAAARIAAAFEAGRAR